MPDQLFKLQPHRTMYLWGADRRGAVATMHHASATGFEITGNWADQADFTAAVLVDAHDPFGHMPTSRYLPDYNMTGVVLDFDLALTGCQSPTSTMYQSVPWGDLSYITRAVNPVTGIVTETPGTTPLNITGVTGGSVASCTYTVTGTPVVSDRVELVYLSNIAWDYTYNGMAATLSFGFWNYLGAGFNHTITIGSNTYSHIQLSTDGSGDIATALAFAINQAFGGTGDPNAFAVASANNVILTAKNNSGATITCSAAPDGNVAGALLEYTDPASMVAGNMVALINGTNWALLAPSIALLADVVSTGVFVVYSAKYGTVTTSGTAVTLAGGASFVGNKTGDLFVINQVPYFISTVNSPTSITLTTSAGVQSTPVAYLAPAIGSDGNSVELLSMHKTSTMVLTPGVPITPVSGVTCQKLVGGADPTSVHVKIDFSAHGLTSLRQMWMTLAPALQYDSGTTAPTTAAYVGTNWSAVFTNWTVTDSGGVTPLKIAGPGSVTMNSRDSWAVYAGSGWAQVTGWYAGGFAKQSSNATDFITITYNCQFGHDLYLGTGLHTAAGTFAVTVDGVAQTPVSGFANAPQASPIYSRLLIKSGVASGQHTVVLTVSSGLCLFDFLQAAVRSDPPAPSATYPTSNMAWDFDTAATYQRPPAATLWASQQAGFTGDIDFYAGVFFALKRVRFGGNYHTATVTIAGAFNTGTLKGDGDAAFLQVGGAVYGDGLGTAFGVAVFANDTVDTVAQRFVNAINTLFVGVRAWYSGTGQLTIKPLSPINGFTLFSKYTRGTGVNGANPSTGTITVVGDILSGNEGVWAVDPTPASPLNRAFSDYLTDLAGLVHAAGQTMTVAFSQELLSPPDSNDAAPASVTFGFWNYLGTGFNHTITIGSVTYSYIQKAEDGSGDLAIALANLINAGNGDPNAYATPSANNVILTPRGTGNIVCSAAPDGNGPGTLKSGAWSQRFANGTPVMTATGFGSWGAGVVSGLTTGTYYQPGHGYITGNVAHFAGTSSRVGSWTLNVVDVDYYTLGVQVIDANHPYSAGYTPAVGDTLYVDLQTIQCNFNPATTTAYMQKCYLQAAGILLAASLVPWLQFGEVGWWFYPRVNGLTIGYASYTAPISIGTSSPHGLVTGQGVIDAGVLVNTAANGDFIITVTDSTHFTLNGSSGNGTGSTGTVAGGGMAYYDAHTLSGRALGNWYTQDDDPSAGSYGDANYLRDLAYIHMHSIAQAVRASYPGAKFEWLLPLDVNNPTAYWNSGYPYPQGGRLNNYINIPFQYKAPNSDIDRVKIEALSWGLSYYNVDLTVAAIAYASTVLSYPKAATAFLVPWSNGSCAWKKHYLAAVNAQIPIISFWALDHLSLLSWPVTMPTNAAYPQFL